jgi:hypothetical protein
MPKDIIKEYIKILDSIYGVFLDGCQGFSSAKSLFEKSQLLTLEKNKRLHEDNQHKKGVHYNLSIKEFDASCMIYSKGKKGESDYRVLHYCPTQGEYKRRNSPDGENYRFIGNMALISIYEYWESSCRNKVAAFYGVKQKQIKSEIFGDLRLIRNSIIHHAGIALPEIEKCKRFNWYKNGDTIFIDGDQMEDIVSAIKNSGQSLYFVEKA